MRLNIGFAAVLIFLASASANAQATGPAVTPDDHDSHHPTAVVTEDTVNLETPLTPVDTSPAPEVMQPSDIAGDIMMMHMRRMMGMMPSHHDPLSGGRLTRMHAMMAPMPAMMGAAMGAGMMEDLFGSRFDHGRTPWNGHGIGRSQSR